MIESLSSGTSLQFQPGNSAKTAANGASKVKLDINAVPKSKVKLDINSVPESKVKVDVKPLASAGAGKGLRIDISA